MGNVEGREGAHAPRPATQRASHIMAPTEEGAIPAGAGARVPLSPTLPWLISRPGSFLSPTLPEEVCIGRGREGRGRVGGKEEEGERGREKREKREGGEGGEGGKGGGVWGVPI